MMGTPRAGDESAIQNTKMTSSDVPSVDPWSWINTPYTHRQINLYRMFLADFSVNYQPILMKFCKDYMFESRSNCREIFIAKYYYTVDPVINDPAINDLLSPTTFFSCTEHLSKVTDL